MANKTWLQRFQMLSQQPVKFNHEVLSYKLEPIKHDYDFEILPTPNKTWAEGRIFFFLTSPVLSS